MPSSTKDSSHNPASSDDDASLIRRWLFGAAKAGNVDQVEELLLQHESANINWQDEDRWTPLMYAAWNGSAALVRFLLRHKADVNMIDSEGKNAMDFAMSRGHSTIATMLGHHIAPPSRTGKDREPAKASAMPRKPTPVAAGNPNTVQWFFGAVKAGYADDVEQLIVKKRANVLWQDDDAWTPLMYATWNGSVDVVRVLLKHGADVHSVDLTGQSALDMAHTRGHVHIATMLEGILGEQLVAAASNGKLQLLHRILSKGVDVNWHDKVNGWTALHVASATSHADLVGTLLNQNACVDMPDSEGSTALLIASSAGCVAVVDTLIAHGANVNHVNFSGYTALHLASQAGQLDTVRLLVAAGANVGLTTLTGQTAKHLALDRDHGGVVAIIEAIEAQVLAASSAAHLAAGNAILALQDADECLTRGGDAGFGCKGRALLSLGQFDEALVCFTEGLLRDDATCGQGQATATSVLAARARRDGNAALCARQYAIAIGHFSKLVALGDAFVTDLASRSVAYLGVGNCKAALDDAIACRRLAPDSVDGFLRHGVALMRLRLYDDALAVYCEGIIHPAIHSADLAVLKAMLKQQAAMWRSEVHVTTDSPREAAAALTRIIAFDGQYADDYAKRCAVYLRLNDTDLAWMDAQQCLALGGQDAHACLGAVHLQRLDFDLALAAYNLGLAKRSGVAACVAGLKQTKQTMAVAAAFGPSVFEALVDNPQTSAWLDDDAFLERVQAVQDNPTRLGDVIQDDPRMQVAASIVLDNVAFTRRSSSSELVASSEAPLSSSSPFGPDMYLKLASVPATQPFLGDPTFVAKLDEIAQNPNRLTVHVQDWRVSTALATLIATPVASPDVVARAFGSDMVSKLVADASTVGFLTDPAFFHTLQELQQRPMQLSVHIHDPRIATTLMVLLNHTTMAGRPVEQPAQVSTPDVTTLHELTARLRDAEKTSQWPLMGSFVICGDVVASSNHTIFRVVDLKKTHRQLVAKLTHERHELDFFGRMHGLGKQDVARVFRRLVDCVEWGEVVLANYRCFALVMERGMNNCRDRIGFLQRDRFARFRCLEHILEALLVLHGLDYIHGDVKLDNVVYFGDDAGYKLIDFDHATPFRASLATHCTEQYCPPEMARVILGHAKQPLVAHPSFDVWCTAVLVLKLFGDGRACQEFLHVDDGQLLDVLAAPTFSFRASIDATTLSTSKKERLAKCLHVDPAQRGSLADLVALLPVTTTSSKLFSMTKVYAKLDQMDSKLAGLQGGVDHLRTDVQTSLQLSDEMVALTRDTMATVVQAKRELMRGIFEATNVVVPTSFIVLPFKLEDERDRNIRRHGGGKKGHKKTPPPPKTVEATMSFWERLQAAGAAVVAAVEDSNPMAAAKAAIDGFTQRQALYLYLLDEVTGEPVQSGDGVYPIRIDTASPAYVAFLAANLPLVQRGFQYLKMASSVASFFQLCGVPSISDKTFDVVDALLDAPTSSVADFDVVQDALETNQPHEHARGPALRELERFFGEKDPKKTFAGLTRVSTDHGQALWTRDAAVLLAANSGSGQ
ncbi:Aste57867_13495 [Aphanomyces stellatus]|uniref:Aste57867_13495 protein n=1 Tax=Aphanomyces stellatus TaxID=120398 RepID=A0A485KYL7_9STRA|nr:hypothetical protein As57867_013445 [Aphanomyces stellatus]VFT90333.1 Aste57867_13495 [Aphanomyces stellatus]